MRPDICLHVPSCQVPPCGFQGLAALTNLSVTSTNSQQIQVVKNHGVFAVEVYGRHVMVLNEERRGHFSVSNLGFQDYYIKDESTTSTKGYQYYATPYRITASRQMLSTLLSLTTVFPTAEHLTCFL